MACARCSDLCVTFTIRTPSDLKKALAIASENISDGTIVEAEPAEDQAALGPSATLAQVTNGHTWPDLVSFRFHCTSCGEQFMLEAETYHGSGGSWHPENPEVSRDAL